MPQKKSFLFVIVFALSLFFAGCSGIFGEDLGEQTSDSAASVDYADQYIDLHLHLDGAITLDIAKKLAEIQNIKLPAESDEELGRLLTVPDDCESLNDFLKCFEFPLSLMQTPEGLSEAVRLVADNIRDQGVVYAEIRFAPQNHTKKGMTQQALAKELHVTDKAVSKWERGLSVPDICLFPELAGVLGVSVGDLLLEGSNDETPSVPNIVYSSQPSGTPSMSLSDEEGASASAF